MSYSLIISTLKYPMHDMLRMTEFKTQQTTTRNIAQFIFIESVILIHVFSQ